MSCTYAGHCICKPDFCGLCGRRNGNDSAVTEDQYGVYAAGNLTVTGKETLNINMDISGAGDEITTEYGELKEKLALRYPYDIDGY